MTLHGQFRCFECDYCNNKQYVSRWPLGWVWVKTGGDVKHACGACKDAIPKEKKREGGQRN